jgi:hypothetical protein
VRNCGSEWRSRPPWRIQPDDFRIRLVTQNVHGMSPEKEEELVALMVLRRILQRVFKRPGVTAGRRFWRGRVSRSFMRTQLVRRARATLRVVLPSFSVLTHAKLGSLLENLSCAFMAETLIRVNAVASWVSSCTLVSRRASPLNWW